MTLSNKSSYLTEAHVVSRREFLALTSLGAAGLSLQPFLKSEGPSGEMFSCPQMVGEVSQTSAVLQTRLATRNTIPDASYDTPEVLVRQDIAGLEGIARFEISDNKKFNSIRRTPWQKTDAAHDFIIKYNMQGLQPSTLYFVRVRFGKSKDQVDTGPVSHFTTLPAKNSEESLSFVVSSCMNLGKFFLGGFRKGDYAHSAKGKTRRLGYRTLEVISKLQPDFWIQTGDSLYYDWPRKKGEFRAKTKTEMRAKWHRQWAMPRTCNLLKNVPVFMMVDDHDFRYNDSDDRHNGKDPSADLAKSMFYEQAPIAGHFNYKKQDYIYRTRQANQHLQFWMMDGRFNRDDNNKPDGPDKTMWGKQQFKWLKKTLLESEATFKILCAGTPLIGPDDAYKNDNHTNYGGFQYERDRFFRWLKEHDFDKKNFYIITGDRHWQYHSIHPLGFEEFATGSVADQNARRGRKPGDPDSTDPLGKIRQPYLQKQPTGGFVQLKVEPGLQDRPALLHINTIDSTGNILNSETRRA